MLEAVGHSDVSLPIAQDQPRKAISPAFFKTRTVEGRSISEHQAEMMATFCRPPAAMTGGAKKQAPKKG